MPEQQNREPKVGVAVLVTKGDRILLVKREGSSHGNGTWAPPGGHIQFGEELEQAAARETMEETGVTIDNIKFRTLTNDVFEEGVHYLTIWMTGQHASGDASVNAPDEIAEVNWFTWDSLPEPLFLSLQNLLADKSYPSQTTDQKIGAAIETAPLLPGEKAEALASDTSGVPGESVIATPSLSSGTDQGAYGSTITNPNSSSEIMRPTPRYGEGPENMP